MERMTFFVAIANCSCRNSLKRLWVGATGLCWFRRCWKQSRTLDVRQSHNVIADLLHLRPVDNSGYYCSRSDLLKELLLASWKTNQTQERDYKYKSFFYCPNSQMMEESILAPWRYIILRCTWYNCKWSPRGILRPKRRNQFGIAC